MSLSNPNAAIAPVKVSDGEAHSGEGASRREQQPRHGTKRIQVVQVSGYMLPAVYLSER